MALTRATTEIYSPEVAGAVPVGRRRMALTVAVERSISRGRQGSVAVPVEMADTSWLRKGRRTVPLRPPVPVEVAEAVRFERTVRRVTVRPDIGDRTG